jgi:[ribosomal protein S18]-alanine N-acetyltransferase
MKVNEMNHIDLIDLLDIRKQQNKKEAKICAEILFSSDPWKTLGYSYETCLKITSDKTCETYVAHCADAIAGFIVINLTCAFKGYVQIVAVAEKYRRHGVGNSLLRFAEDLIFKKSPNVFICVSSFNGSAIKFYEKSGYLVAGELKDYLVSGHSELLLRKTIGPILEFGEKNKKDKHI